MHIGLDQFQIGALRKKIGPSLVYAFNREAFGRADTKLTQNHENRVDVHDDVGVEGCIVFGNSEKFLDRCQYAFHTPSFLTSSMGRCRSWSVLPEWSSAGFHPRSELRYGSRGRHR